MFHFTRSDTIKAAIVDHARAQAVNKMEADPLSYAMDTGGFSSATNTGGFSSAMDAGGLSSDDNPLPLPTVGSFGTDTIGTPIVYISHGTNLVLKRVRSNHVRADTLLGKYILNIPIDEYEIETCYDADGGLIKDPTKIDVKVESIILKKKSSASLTTLPFEAKLQQLKTSLRVVETKPLETHNLLYLLRLIQGAYVMKARSVGDVLNPLYVEYGTFLWVLEGHTEITERVWSEMMQVEAELLPQVPNFKMTRLESLNVQTLAMLARAIEARMVLSYTRHQMNTTKRSENKTEQEWFSAFWNAVKALQKDPNVNNPTPAVAAPTLAVTPLRVPISTSPAPAFTPAVKHYPLSPPRTETPHNNL